MTKSTQSKQSRAPKKVKASKAQVGEVARQPSNDPRAPKGKENKIGKVIGLLQRPDGATLNDLVAATNWQPHTTRAALTGLKKKGHAISSEKAEGVRRYRVSDPQ